MLRLKKLTMKNFLSHKDSKLDIGSKSGLIQIAGINESGLYDSNGSGKSSILEGIIYALSGNTLRNVGVNDIVNRNTGKDTVVSLEFISDNVTYVVDRYRKDTTNGDKIYFHSKSENSEEDLSKRLNKDTQELINSKVDIPYNVLINTMFLGEGLSSRFTQLSDPEKKSLIESTLNLSYDLNKSKARAHENLQSLKLRKATLEGQLSTIEEMLREDRGVLENNIVIYEEMLNTNQSDYEGLVKSIDSLELEKSSIDSKLSLIKDSIDQWDRLDSNLKRIDEEAASYVQAITDIESVEEPVCTLCKQSIKSESSREEVINSYRSKIDTCMSQMKEWQSAINNLPDRNLLANKYQEISDRVNSISQELSISQRNSAVLLANIATAKANKKYAEDVLSNYDQHLISKERILQEIIDVDISISQYDYFYKLYSPTGLITLILEEAINYINSRISVYGNLLLDKSYMIKLNKGKLSLEDSKGSTYQSLSNGEKRRLDIAIQFSLHDYTHMYCGIGVDTLIIDEILDTLDATGVNNIIEVLNIKRDYCNLERIFVITHNNELKSYFDEIITVKKLSDGNSYIDN